MRSEYRLWPNEMRIPVPVKGGRAWVVFDLFSGERVELDDGSRTPREFTYVEMPDDSAAPYFVIELEWHGEPLAPRILAVQAIARDDQRQVTASDLKRIRLEDAVERACTIALKPSTAWPTNTVLGSQEAARRLEDDAGRRRTITGLRSQSRTQITDDVHKQVAAIYQRNPGAPTKAVAQELRLAPSTASLYVKRAREAGFLPSR